MRKSTRGFTLVELAVVIGVIAILATIILIAYNGVQSRSRDARRQTDIANLVKALELYYDDNGQYPDPVGSTSTINGNWYSSNDSSWDTFSSDFGTSFTPAKDPVNNNHPLNSTGLGYAYFTGGYCGATNAQWYLIVYRLETLPKEKHSEGDCSTNPLGDSYYTSYGDSYYRVVR